MTPQSFNATSISSIDLQTATGTPAASSRAWNARCAGEGDIG